MKVSNTSERLQELLAYFNIKQSDIVSKTGLAKSTISMYLKNKREPEQNSLTLIADAYGVDEVWLMGYDVPMFKGEYHTIEGVEKITDTLMDALDIKNDSKLFDLICIWSDLSEDQQNIILATAKMFL